MKEKEDVLLRGWKIGIPFLDTRKTMDRSGVERKGQCVCVQYVKFEVRNRNIVRID